MKKAKLYLCFAFVLILLLCQSNPASSTNIPTNQETIDISTSKNRGGVCSSATVVQAECEALVAFYNSTNGYAWDHRDNWAYESDVGTWYGVTVEDNHVTQIVLNNNNLTGQIPMDIGLLPYLTSLSLQNNFINNELPWEMGNLTNLTSLRLSVNNFEGPIPQSFINLINLNEFYFNDTWLCEPPNIEFIAWKNTVAVWFSNGNYCLLCDIVTDVPKIECEALGKLFLSTSGPEWVDFSNWWATIEVDKWFGVIVQDNHVTVLDLEENNLEGELATELSNLSQLRFLYLSKNSITGTIPESYGNLSNLKALWLHENDLTDGIPSSFGDLDNLEVLMLHDNALNGELPPEMGSMDKLRTLILYKNDLTGPIPPQMGDLANLEYLSLWDNQLSGKIPSQLGQLQFLTDLELAWNNLEGQLPPELGNLNNLDTLTIQGNQDLIGPIPLSFTNLSNLEGFSFYSTGLCEPDDRSFQDWKSTVPTWFGTGLICKSCYLPIILNP